jgi:hypothetical protein
LSILNSIPKVFDMLREGTPHPAEASQSIPLVDMNPNIPIAPALQTTVTGEDAPSNQQGHQYTAEEPLQPCTLEHAAPTNDDTDQPLSTDTNTPVTATSYASGSGEGTPSDQPSYQYIQEGDSQQVSATYPEPANDVIGQLVPAQPMLADDATGQSVPD